MQDAFKSFCPATADGAGGGAAKGCCGGKKEPPKPHTEVPFPPQLMPGAFESRNLRLESDGVTWHRPTSLRATLEIKKAIPFAKFVVGNSELEIERKFRSSTWEHLVCTTHVPDLNILEVVMRTHAHTHTHTHTQRF